MITYRQQNPYALYYTRYTLYTCLLQISTKQSPICDLVFSSAIDGFEGLSFDRILTTSLILIVFWKASYEKEFLILEGKLFGFFAGSI